MATENKVQLVNFDGTTISGRRGPRGFTSAAPVDDGPQFTDVNSFELNTYKTYYYSGGQAQIYLEDVFLDEVANLTFTTVTNKSPIYGYASERFDTVAKGNMLIQGSFTINFVSAGYLQIVSQIVREGNGDAKSDNPDRRDLLLNGVKFREIDSSNTFELTQAINQIRGFGNAEFKQLSKEMYDRKSRSRVLNAQFYELPPFDIFAVFGDINDSTANHTVRQIKEVYLTGQSQVISSSGEAIMEQYTFIARDIG